MTLGYLDGLRLTKSTEFREFGRPARMGFDQSVASLAAY